MKALACIFVLLLCQASPQAVADDIEDFNMADKLYKKGRFDEALDAANRFISKHPKSPLLPDALYIAGRLSADVAVALDDFSRIILNHPQSSVVDNALFMIAQYHYASHSYDKAAIRFRFIAEKYKKSDVSDAAHWWLCQSYSAAGDSSSARIWARKLLERFPTSKYAKLLSPKVQVVEPAVAPGFTIQVGSFLKKETAVALKQSLVRKGYDAYVTRNEISGKVLFRVRVGAFSTREEASKHSKTLKDVEGLNGWITAGSD
ncbi:MAG: SPOR domain-containing protein [bacterium]